MPVRVGVIGVGMIGQDHIRRITRVLSGGTVVAVTDVNSERARQVAAGLPGAAVHPTAADLIAASDVDAVLVASWGAAHEEQVIAAIGAGKPVFCEKPLAPSKDACLRIIDAELAAGRRLVQVGFMRRYDAGYLAMKAVLEDGGIGAPLMMHCAHRNPSVPPYGFTTGMSITDSAVHEIDMVRWMFGEEVAAASVLKPRRTSKAAAGEHDPLIVLLEMASGVLVDDEVFVNAAYGYDIRGEVVGESGTVALAEVGQVIVRADGRITVHGEKPSPQGGRVPADWRERFASAYDAELRDWLTAAAQGTCAGPSSWDGYAAAAVTDSCLEALRTGRRVAVLMAGRPDFYAKEALFADRSASTGLLSPASDLPQPGPDKALPREVLRARINASSAPPEPYPAPVTQRDGNGRHIQIIRSILVTLAPSVPIPFDVDAAFMQLGLREGGIHAVYTERIRPAVGGRMPRAARLCRRIL